MRNPILPPLMLLALAAALYLLPDGAFQTWRLYLNGSLARLWRPADPRRDASFATTSTERDLLDILALKDAEIAGLHKRLADLAITRQTVDKVKIVPARIVRLGPGGNLDAFTLDAGSKDGVAPGHAVVVGQALVGVVAKAERDASLALSLSSPGCYISARFGEPGAAGGRPRVLGAIQGAGAGMVNAIVFSSSTPAQDGWLAMTSGLEKSVPEGLMLGTLSGDFREGAESGTMEARLTPALDPATLDFVAVVARE